MGGENLEEELIKVVRTLEELQCKYLKQLDNDDEVSVGEDPAETLNDYKILSTKMFDWIGDCEDNISRMNILVHRSFVRCCETSHASLLIPILKIMKKIVRNASGRDVACHSSQVFRKLSVHLSKKIILSADALQRLNSDSVFYTKYEAKEILEKSSAILNFLCQNNSNLTRFIIEKFEELKPSLQYSIQTTRNEDSKNLFEAVESEEECMREKNEKEEATLKIQATFRMYKQKCRWRKLKQGMIALQRLTRLRHSLKQINVNGENSKEELFVSQLDEVVSKKHEMERRYRILSKLHPNRVNSFLEWEKEKAVMKIQCWWRKMVQVEAAVEESETERRDAAAMVIQGAVRRWLVARQSPVWSSVINQPRVISEERARHLRREIEVWQQKHTVFSGDKEEMSSLHRESQQKYNRFVAGLASRRIAEHRSKLVRAQLRTNLLTLETAPALADYDPGQWSSYHALPLDVATAARIQHNKQLQQLQWPTWKRKIQEAISS